MARCQLSPLSKANLRHRAAEWVRRSNPVALGLLLSGLAGQIPVNSMYQPILIKNRIEFYSYMRKSRKDRLQSHI
jgi:hypothetical protein